MGTTLQNGGLNGASGSGLSGNMTQGGVSMSGMGRSGRLNQEQLAWLADPQLQNSYSYARRKLNQSK